MSGTSREHLQKVWDLSQDIGIDAAAIELDVKRETVRRYIREWKELNDKQDSQPFDEKLLRQIRDRFTDAELKRLIGGSAVDNNYSTAEHSFEGDEVTIGCITDTHLGSVYTDPEMLFQAFDVFANHGVDFIAHCGDVHEGLSHRAGHMYECSHLGYSNQLDHSRDVFSRWTDTDVYMIDGNHDRWFIKSNGALIVQELCNSQENLHFLGHDEGNIKIGGIIIKLWHGEDGSSYAFSYRIQKLVEAFTGGEKPNVLLCGHTHKAFPMFDRHIHCCSVGALQKQSKWMRAKRQASHTGFYVIKMGVADSEVKWFEPRFFPFYK